MFWRTGVPLHIATKGTLGLKFDMKKSPLEHEFSAFPSKAFTQGCSIKSQKTGV
jgi:hypothetical protein